MNGSTLSRREALQRTGILTGAALALGASLPTGAAAPGDAAKGAAPFRFCLNTATIRGHKLGIVREVEMTAKAGYDGIEPWVDSVQ